MKTSPMFAAVAFAVMFNISFASSVQDELSVLQDDLYETIQSVDPDSVEIFSALSEAISIRQELIRKAGKNYILVNIKDYTLRAVKNGKEVLHDKVIIGTPEQPTPLLDGKYITTIVTNPGWTVSPNTALLRIAPRFARSSNYASVMGFKVYSSWNDNAELMDPKHIDWNKWITAKRIPYKIYQKPSRFNSLGQVKFVIPNTNGIFIHGSPYKKLFDEKKREFSAGCVRMLKTIELADVLLDKVSKETLSNQIESGRTHYFKLPSPIKVFIVDWPVTVNHETNKVAYR
jgi:murein L,D-transpeptidase YcbB/YkuD